MTPITEVTARLLATLGRTLVSYITETRDRSLPARWAGGTVVPTEDQESRLRVAWEILSQITETDGVDVARQWLVAANPRLDRGTVADRIRDGDFPAAKSAARAFVDDQYYA